MIMTGWGWISRRLLILASPRVTALESMVTLGGFLSPGEDAVVAAVLAVAAEVGAAAGDFSFFLDFLEREDESRLSILVLGWEHWMIVVSFECKIIL